MVMETKMLMSSFDQFWIHFIVPSNLIKSRAVKINMSHEVCNCVERSAAHYANFSIRSDPLQRNCPGYKKDLCRLCHLEDHYPPSTCATCVIRSSSAYALNAGFAAAQEGG